MRSSQDEVTIPPPLSKDERDEARDGHDQRKDKPCKREGRNRGHGARPGYPDRGEDGRSAADGARRCAASNQIALGAGRLAHCPPTLT